MSSRKRTPTIEEILAPGGRLSQHLAGYQHRAQQIEAAHAIEEAFENGRVCFVEAGTGVGKTLAYLIPAVRAAARHKTTVVSTHTINLQTQLMEKDIPLVQELFMGPDNKPLVEVNAVLMKGRANYLCLQDLDAAEADLFQATDPVFRDLKAWVRRTTTGDVADLPFAYPDWYEVAANQDTCRGQECRYYNRCFYYRMRWSAADANLIVVNHALFLSDLMLRSVEGEKGILPEYDHVVFDEAHHLEDVATKAFGLEMGNRRIPAFTERLRRLRDLDLNLDRLRALDDLNEELFSPFQAGGRTEFFFHDVLDETREASARQTATRVNASLAEVASELQEKAKDEEGPTLDRLQGMARIATRIREELQTLVSKADPDFIQWGEHMTPTEGRRRHAAARPLTTLHYTPIHVGKLLRDMLWGQTESAVLTSATLSNSGGFSYLRARLGAPEEAIERVIGSPFDFKQQALLYVPRGLPEPPKGSVPAYTEAVAKEVERVVGLSEGRAFLLFTSRRMLNEVYEILKEKLTFPLFRQGDLPPGRLLEEFRNSGNGCLFGTQTFWEGVDVRGEALSVVIIDRLPFAVPDSPITRARTDAIAAEGGDWFRDFSIPQAQIRLKQGFGRLIRTATDRGIVCILDTRLLTKPYGAEFVRHLPPASRASVWTRVARFWHADPDTDNGVEGAAAGAGVTPAQAEERPAAAEPAEAKR